MHLRAAASTIRSTFEDALIDGESLSNSEVAWTPTAIALPEKLRKYSHSKAISIFLTMEQMPGSSTFYVLLFLIRATSSSTVSGSPIGRVGLEPTTNGLAVG